MGSLITSVSGGVAPYTYLWSNGSTSADLIAYSGAYSVTVTDALGNSIESGSAYISDPIPIQSYITFSQPLCAYAPALLDLNINGGTPPYSFYWAVTGATTEDTYAGPSGVYTVEITDANGCSHFDIASVYIPAPLVASISADPVDCFNSTQSTIVATASGGTGPYTYSWSTGESSPTLNNVSPGTYNLTAMDANGCTDYSSVAYQYTPFTPQASFQGINNGIAIFSATSDATNANYQWQTFNGSWVNLTNSATFSGVNTSSLSAVVSGNLNNQQLFRCVLTTAECDGTTNQVQLIFPPQVTDLTPSLLCPSGSGTVTITGSNFANVTGVSFGSQPALSFTVNNQNTITATYPAQTASQSIVVTTISGSAASTPYEILTFSISQLPDNTNDNAISYEALSNSPTNNYQWQSNIGFGYQSLSDVGQYSGVNTNALTVSNLTALNNNQLVRCINTIVGCTLTSESLAISTSFDYTPATANNNSLPGISYQAVVRDGSAAIYHNQPINVRFSIHDETATGAIEYSETSSATTNTLGLFTLVLGNGTPTSGNFNAIQWSNSNKFLQVEVDLGQGFVDIGTQQMLSVPFAKLSEKSRSLEVQSLPVFETNAQALAGGLSAGQIYRTSNGDIRVVF